MWWCLAVAHAAPWVDATDATIGATAEWSNKVELADLDGDGLVDILFANGGDYASAGAPEPSRVFRNLGGGAFEPWDVLPVGLTRVVKVRDLDGDGHADILVGGAYQTPSTLLLGPDLEPGVLPTDPLSVGDLEVGDVDGDGDLDVVLADWGAGNPLSNEGGVTRLWLQEGGAFVDATEHMPQVLVRFSWDLELFDVDNDYDLDVMVSCKSCAGSFLFHNDGTGAFVDASERLPAYANNYDFEPLDADGDGFLDVVTINDGPQLKEHLFRNDGSGGFEEAAWRAEAQVPFSDDNVAVVLDYESDGDPDVLIGSLSGGDRLLLNDDGKLTLVEDVLDGPSTPGTLGLAAADLDGDGALDLVMSQGEVADPDKVYLADEAPPDTSPPVVDLVETFAPGAEGPLAVRARVHDTKSPVMAYDFQRVELVWTGPDGAEERAPMVWTGGHLWRGTLAFEGEGTVSYGACATDRAGNERCADGFEVVFGAPSTPEPEPDPAPTVEQADGGGCGCATGPGSGAWVFGLLVLARRRR